MRPIHLYCIAVLFIVAGNAAAESVWKWTDEKGVVHYSDHPQGPDAVEVNISTNTQTYSAEEAQTGLPTPSSSAPAAKSNQTYQAVEIVRPAAEETFQNPEGSISVQVSPQPGLKSGDNLQLFLDGKMVGSGSSSSFSLSDVERGAHVLQARIVGSNGITIIASPSVTFYVQKASIHSPSNSSNKGPNNPPPSVPPPARPKR